MDIFILIFICIQISLPCNEAIEKGKYLHEDCPLVSIHFDVYSLGELSTLANIWKIETSKATQSGEVKDKFLPDVLSEMKGNTIIITEIECLEWR